MAISNIVRKVKGPEAQENGRGQYMAPRRRQEHPLSLFGTFDPFRTDMDQLLNAYFNNQPDGAAPRPTNEAWGRFTPSMDVRDNGKEISVLAELPGLDEDNIYIELTSDRLTIRGEKRDETDQRTKEGWQRIERRFGAFERSIILPDGIDSENVTADFKNGVLCVTIPRRPEARLEKKIIAVRSGKSNAAAEHNRAQESENKTAAEESAA